MALTPRTFQVFTNFFLSFFLESYGEYNGLTEKVVNAHHHHQSLVNVNWDFGYATVLGPPFSFLTYVFFLHVARETQYIFQWETSERNIDEVPKRRHNTILSLQHEVHGMLFLLFSLSPSSST